jgi:uncharacterized protein (UPF0276 family)
MMVDSGGVDLDGTVGLGFRLGMAKAMLERNETAFQFVEIAPENYLGVGGKRARLLAMAKERWPIVAHGLCGDLAGSAPMNDALLEDLRVLLKDTGAAWYSDHLCLTHAAGSELHELVPTPMNDEWVERFAHRISELQKRLEVPVAIENVSAYTRMPDSTMPEHAFVAAVAEAADCKILLDVNNVYVNAHNFGDDAEAFIRAMPMERVAEIHMAGHHVEDEETLLDTHGAAIVDPVYELLAFALGVMKEKRPTLPPILLERDHNFPALTELEDEVMRLRGIVEGQRHAA